jgi:hypothetical protein
VRTWKCGSLHAYYLDYDMTTSSTTCTNTEDIKIKMLASVQAEREGKERTKMIHMYIHRIYLQNLGGMDNLLSDSLAI